jgi:hypothetical protein
MHVDKQMVHLLDFLHVEGKKKELQWYKSKIHFVPLSICLVPAWIFFDKEGFSSYKGGFSMALADLIYTSHK